jgi:DNA invertase Pin-like site-specific DNA recombinase
MLPPRVLSCDKTPRQFLYKAWQGKQFRSIENQQNLIARYAEDRGWRICKSYIDDDFSGANFDRPGFREMMGDIEGGLINCVITKDLSRLGRNYLEAGRYREIFAEQGVRYVAILDGHDSADSDGYDIATPIKEIVNEMYCADISRKIRSSKRVLASQGKFINSRPPYGYMKSAGDKHVLAVDEGAAGTVRRIYALYLGGATGRGIADRLNRDGVPTPNEYFYGAAGRPDPFMRGKRAWATSTVLQILRNPAYYGATGNGKSAAVSFKSKKLVRKPAEEWVVVEGTHEPLVGKDSWLEAQRKLALSKRDKVRRKADGEVSLFAGIIKCADCGANMVFCKKENKSGTREYYRCSTYASKGKSACRPHQIDCRVVCEAVLSDVRRYAALAAGSEKRLVDRILKASGEGRAKSLARCEREAAKAGNRIAEIDQIVQNLYEDKVRGDITAEQFKRMAARYDGEREKLAVDLASMEKELERQKQDGRDMAKWVERIKDCLNIECLTREIVTEMVERIEVSQTYDVGGKKNLDMAIFYKFGLGGTETAIEAKG